MSKTALVLSIIGLGFILGGCATPVPASVKGGVCKLFNAPPYAYKGKTFHDQSWIDDTIERGVAGCHWKRPKARPAGWDANGNPVSSPAPTQPAKKKHQILRKLWPFNRG